MTGHADIDDTTRLESVLAPLVADGTLTAGQGEAVRRAFSAALAPAPAEHTGERLRSRLLEAAAYLGALLVSASLVALLAQRWPDLSQAAQVATLGGLAILALAVGTAVTRTTPGGADALLQPASAPRRRVASVALTAGALLTGAALGIALPDVDASGPISVGAALLVIVVGQRVAPSALTEVAMFGATMALVGSSIDAAIGGAVENEAPVVGDAEPVTRSVDYVLPIALATTGVLWAALVAARLRLPEVARVLGLAAALYVTIPLAASTATRGVGLAVLAVLAAVGFGAYLRTRLWPWLAVAALAVAVFVVILVGQSAGTAAGLLLAGLLLLGAAGWAGWRARHAQRPL